MNHRFGSLILSGCALLLLLLLLIPLSLQADELEDRLAKLEEAGKPIDLTQLWPADAKQNTNGAKILAKGFKSVRDFELAMFKYDENIMILSGINEKDLAFYDREIRKHPELVATIERVARAGCFIPNFDFTLAKPQDAANDVSNQTTRLKSVTRVLFFRVRILVAKGKPEAAANAALQMMAIANHAQSQPFITSHLIGCTCHRMALLAMGYVLQHAELADETRKKIDGALARYELATMQRALETERAYGLASSKFLSKKTRLAYLNYCEFQLANAGETFPQYQANLKKLDADVRRDLLRQPLVAMVEPAIAQVRRANTGVLGLSRCVRILNRIQQKKITLEKNAIQQLGLLAEVTQDPFTLKPVTVRKMETGWQVSFSGASIQPRDADRE